MSQIQKETQGFHTMIEVESQAGLRTNRSDVDPYLTVQSTNIYLYHEDGAASAEQLQRITTV
ncbi:hypothetical protein PHLCEN_2v5748 [Hermanssonia centrifuga]|uniref:Uncharacterized protein n=1 Tax=Hermanssonia centrifuga TaxID=98765 RepID=A0A2R6P1N6_9APHY|nr:hypothetical protein PHLCEN_2v5748 [Hermanssonia centrifuga]